MANNSKVIATIQLLNTNELLFTYEKEGIRHSKYVSRENVRAAFDLGIENDSGWLNHGVVRLGANATGKWVVSCFPAQVVTISLEATELKVPMPTTVMMGWKQTYFIWALNQPMFESTATAYKVPVSNVYDDGRICWGSNRPGATSPQNMLRAWSMFFGTIFNQHEDDNKCFKYPKSILRLLQELNGKKTFPEKELVQMWPRTIGEVINSRLKAGLK